MFEKEFQEWFEINKKWLYSMDHVQAAYSAWCAGVKQQQAVEHTLALDTTRCICNFVVSDEHILMNPKCPVHGSLCQ